METFDDGGSWQSYKEAHGGKMPSPGAIYCPPAQQKIMNLSKSWLGLNCLRPMEHSDGIFVSGIDIAADSDDPAYIHDKDDEVQAYVKDRTTDVYQFLQVPYESVMLGMLSIHWSRQSIIPKLMAIHISWSRDGVHFERPEQNTPLLDYSTIDMAKLNQRSPHVFPYATSKIDCESFVGGGILMEAHDVQDMTLVTKCTYLPFGDSASHSRAANGIINLNQFWTLRRDGFASIDTVPQEDEEVSPLYAHPDVLETKWLLSDACPTNGLGCSAMAQKLRRLNSRMGTSEARFLLRAFGGRSALSGATWNLTIRPWNPLFEMSLSNIILLTRKEAAHHDDIGGMCGYPYLFRIHIVELLRETLLDKPLDTGCMEPVAVVDETNQVIEYCYVPTTNTSEWDSRLPPKLSHCDNWCRVDEWTRALQLWWGLKFNATAPVVVMKAIVGALERKSSFL